MDKISDQEEEYNLQKHPNPNDFDKYLPWACTQLSVEANIVITRKYVANHVNATGKPKAKRKVKASNNTESPSNTSSDESATFLTGFITDNPIYLETVYDSNQKLIQLKFTKNKPIPRVVMKIIGLLIPFHKSLYSISINSGLQAEAVYEIAKFLTVSNITDICLDNTFLMEANYHILLDHSGLKHLSLSKCRINDAVVKIIANKLVYPNPASKTLSLLNLSTNTITDLGAQYLSNTLRSNRQLSYLNLADNMISDLGALSILNTLIAFPLTMEELKGKRARRISYFNEKKELMMKTLRDIRIGDYDKKGLKRKAKVTAPLLKKSKVIDSTGENEGGLPSLEPGIYEKAETIVEGKMGPFTDPFSPNNTDTKNGIIYCHGNNSLCYLNIAFNNITFIAIKKLHEVILTQQIINSKVKSKGLINVIIEGNLLPNDCLELQQIDDLLEGGLASYSRASVAGKKRAHSSAPTSTTR